MMLPPNSSLQAPTSPGSVGLLHWDILGAKMALLAALVVQELFGLALSSTTIPVHTCCPPGHFLAIEDWAESWQDPEGNWIPNIGTPAYKAQRHMGSPIGGILRQVKTARERDMLERVYSDRYMSNFFYSLIPRGGLFYNAKRQDFISRHDFISRVQCVQDKNDMPAIDGATADESNTLAKDQVLQSKGLFPRQCDTESELVDKVFFFRFTDAIVPLFTALHCCARKK